jgi:hypothetical protein
MSAFSEASAVTNAEGSLATRFDNRASGSIHLRQDQSNGVN